MSSISGPTGLPPTLPPQTSDTQTPDAPQTPTGVPFYENLGFSSPAATIGVHLPQNPEDVQAILSEVAQQLDQTVDKLRDQRDQAIADAVAAARAGILATAQALTATGLRLTDENNQLAGKKAELSVEKTKLAQDQQTLSAAKTQPEKDAAQAAVDADNAAIAATQADIDALQTSVDQDTAVYTALQTALTTILTIAAQAAQTQKTATVVNTSTDLGRDQVTSQEFDKIFDGLRDLANSQDARDVQRAFDHRALVDKDTVERLAQAVIGLLPGATPLPSPFDIAQSAFATATGSRLKIPL